MACFPPLPNCFLSLQTRPRAQLPAAAGPTSSAGSAQHGRSAEEGRLGFGLGVLQVNVLLSTRSLYLFCFTCPPPPPLEPARLPGGPKWPRRRPNERPARPRRSFMSALNMPGSANAANACFPLCFRRRAATKIKENQAAAVRGFGRFLSPPLLLGSPFIYRAHSCHQGGGWAECSPQQLEHRFRERPKDSEAAPFEKRF